MDTRAELLLDELATMPVGKSVDFNYWRGRFQSLFDEKLDDQTRQSLLTSYANLLDFVERSLVEQGHNPAQFQDARETDWRSLCIQEALHRSATELFEAHDLNEIVQREIAAGRMQHSSFTQLAADGAAVLDRRDDDGPKKGFFKRLFG